MKYIKPIIIALLTLFFLIVTYSIGITIGLNRVGSYAVFNEYVLAIYNKINPPVVANYIDKELAYFNSGFSEDLINDQLIYDKIHTIDQLDSLLESDLLPVEKFFSVYDQLEILEVDTLQFVGKKNILKILYSVDSTLYTSYSYLLYDTIDNSTQLLIFPGSGVNQSFSIVNEDPNNYHYGILEYAKEKKTSAIVLIKPNEGVLAYHNGVKKLSESYIVNYSINRGGSYSASYIADGIAICKYVNSISKKLTIAGLSQGGTAALLASLQVEPEKSIISSGFSVLQFEIEPSGHDQIIIPNLYKYYTKNNLKEIMSNLNTQFLFTYGEKEDLLFGLETVTNTTKNYFSESDNVQYYIHINGHVFPYNYLIKNF
ncbi:MAG: hypothetical protein NXI08_08510 [bacterium]|nr:hypothetical protein [bacterium]